MSDRQSSTGHLMGTYPEPSARFVRGQGSWLWDDKGLAYLDFLSGIAVTSLGHCHPDVVGSLERQSRRLWHVSNFFANELAEEVASTLDRLIGAGEQQGGRVFFANSGAEANECAIKLARRFNGSSRSGVVSAYGSFHGRTLASLAATGQPSKWEAFQPLPEGFRHVAWDDLDALEAALAPEVGAVLLEPIQGEAGVIEATPGYLKEVRRLCDERGLLLIADEVQTGLGRTGAWFGFQHEDVMPDIVTMAKALGNGMPVGACWARPEVASAFRPGDHGSTFGGQPLALSAAAATLEVMQREDIPTRANRVGAHLYSAIAAVPGVASVRGKGLLRGAVLEAGSPPASEVVRLAMEAGLVLNAPAADVVRLAPSLLVSEEEIDAAAAVLSDLLAGRQPRRPEPPRGLAAVGRAKGSPPSVVDGARSSGKGRARHFLDMDDLSPSELEEVLVLAERPGSPTLLRGAGVALVFEHPSARTRNAAEMAVVELGGHPLSMKGDEVGIDARETAEDLARTLACYHRVLGARVRDHGTLSRFVRAFDSAGISVPVVNLLSDRSHPTQAVADLLTLRSHWRELRGRRLAYIGDANNVCRSLVMAGAMVGMEVAVASPDGFSLGQEDLERAARAGREPIICSSPEEAAEGADALYTDVWASMGQGSEKDERRRVFDGWGVDERLVSLAAPGALVMHCLPAHRGEEISGGVLEGSSSVVWEQASARREAFVGILSWLLGERP